MIRVAIVDDQPLFSDGLGRIVGAQPEMEVVGTAHDGKSGVAMCQELRPDVVLMDINMPVMNGVAATSRLRELLPDTKVLILTVNSDDVHVFRGIKAGASGYLLKDSDVDEIARAVRAARRGELQLDPAIARRLTSSLRTAPNDPAAELTIRELDVLRLLGAGKANKQIAAELEIGERTARTHVSNILRKLGLSSRTQAALWAVREGLVGAGDGQELTD
jgi:DNA-binding NarL/FixJ family response regulator